MSENTFPTAKLCMDANWIREIFLRTIRVWRFKSGSLPTEINISFFWAPGWLSGNTLNSAPCTGSWVWALMMTNSFLDPSTTSTLSSWFYLVYLIWYHYLSVEFGKWIVKQKIENKLNLFKKTIWLWRAVVVASLAQWSPICYNLPSVEEAWLAGLLPFIDLSERRTPSSLSLSATSASTWTPDFTFLQNYWMRMRERESD